MENIGSCLMMSLKSSQLLKEEKDFIKSYNVAGVILFKRNLKSLSQARELIETLKALSQPSPLIAIDCEGGLVNRLSHLSESYQWPSPKQMSYKELEDIFLIARQMGYQLRQLGIDINFAPVVDWPLVQSELLKSRILGDSPSELVKKASAFVSGLLEEGVRPCLKHFPGHGGVLEDSHETLPQDTRSLKELKPQLDIFENLFKKHDTCIMTAHIEFPKIEKTPATFSKVFLKQILKTERNFKGLVFSDDIDMKALQAFSPGERFFLSLKAGCDMVLCCQNPETPYEIRKYFKQQPLKKRELEEVLKVSSKKILKLRKQESLSLRETLL